jgi:hypothetical protein
VQTLIEEPTRAQRTFMPKWRRSIRRADYSSDWGFSSCAKMTT